MNILADFIKSNHESFYFMALNLARNDEDARDLVASTWARMLRFIGKFDERRASMLTWGVTIMRNEWFSELKRRRFKSRFPKVEIDANDDEAQLVLEVLAEHGSNTRSSFERIWVEAAIRKAMEGLREDERKAVESKLRGESSREAAKRLGWSFRSVDARAFDAYVKLRPVLAAYN